jgi:hypothetical protein
MATIALMTLLVPVVVWLAVRLENSMDRWDSAAAAPDQPAPGEGGESITEPQPAAGAVPAPHSTQVKLSPG